MAFRAPRGWKPPPGSTIGPPMDMPGIPKAKGNGIQRRTTVAPVSWTAYGIPEPVPEFRFHPKRRWKFDWAWPAHLVALECDGSAWTTGRHTRGKGFIADQEKRNAATAMGWRVFHCVPADLQSGKVLTLLAEVLAKV